VNPEERKKKVLQLIVCRYIITAEPVASRSIVRRYKLRVSSATIRNVMANLEKEGFLYQPHTSAGRVPTDKGYRFYVETLQSRRLSERKKKHIQREIKERLRREEQIIEQVSKLLSAFSHYTSLALAPDGRVYLKGRSNLLLAPEFRDPRKTSLIFNLLEKEEALSSLLKNSLPEEGINVLIGKENPYLELQECSLVISHYRIGKKTGGSLGIIGPKRMKYSRVIPLLDLTGKIVKRMLGRKNR
jgi:transcriptional regulator of heat shock response